VRFGAWNVNSLYRSGSVTRVARGLARYKLDLVGVKEVRWDKEEMEVQWIMSLSMEKETRITDWEQNIWYAIK
jgi:exonuclease III